MGEIIIFLVRVGFQNRTRKKKSPNTSPCLNIGSPSKIQSLKVRSQTRNGHRQIRSRKKQTKEKRMHHKKMQLNLNQKKMPLRKTPNLMCHQRKKTRQENVNAHAKRKMKKKVSKFAKVNQTLECTFSSRRLLRISPANTAGSPCREFG